jgi:spermidine synthase
MTRPWRTLATVSTPEGPLELRQRGDRDFLIVIAGRVLMTSAARRSEEALATIALTDLSTAAARSGAPRVLIGGLGMGFTLRAALDGLPPGATVDVAELGREVVDWCHGPLAPLTRSAITDPRVHVHIIDVARLIAAAPPTTYDAILLDLYEGPYAQAQKPDDPVFGPAALSRAHDALARGGVLAVWSEDLDPSFTPRLTSAGFTARTHRRGGAGRSHIIYLGARPR